MRGRSFAAQDTFVAGQEAFAAQDDLVGQGSYDYNGGDGYRAQDPYQDQQQDQGAYATQAFAVQDDFGRPDATAVYAPQPMPEETGQYGVYSPDARMQQPGYGGYDAYNGAVGNGNGDGNGYAYGGGYDQTGAAQDAYATPRGPYPLCRPLRGVRRRPGPGPAGALRRPVPRRPAVLRVLRPYQQADPYAQQPYAAQQYDAQGQPLGQGYGETPPGGVWVPQQRDGELPPEQPYPPYQQPGYDGQQYRY